MKSYVEFILDPNKDLIRQISNKYLLAHPNVLRYRAEYQTKYDLIFDQDGYGVSFSPVLEQTKICIVPRHFCKTDDLTFSDLLSFLRFWEIIK